LHPPPIRSPGRALSWFTWAFANVWRCLDLAMNSVNLQPSQYAAKVGHMCGRYASARSRIELLEEFAVERDRVDEPLPPDYNVAPTKPVYAVMTRAPRRAPEKKPE